MTRRTYILLFSFICLSIFAISCSNGKDEYERPNDQNNANVPSSAFSDISGDLYFDGKGGILTLRFTASKPWKVAFTKSMDSSWLSLDKSSGDAGYHSISITAQQNDGTDERFTYLELTAEGATETVKVVQKPRSVIIVSSNNITAKPEGGQFEVKVSANVSFSVSIDGDWIKQIGTKAMNESTLVFNAEKNDGKDRRATIVFVSDDKKVAETVIVTQKRHESIVLSETSISCPWKQNSVEITVNPDIEYDFACSASWIKHVGTKTTGKTLYFIIEENLGEARSGEVIFTSRGAQETVRLFQEKAPDVIMDDGDLNPIIAQNTEKTIIRLVITSPWTAKVLDTKAASDWLSVSPDHGDAGTYNLEIHTQKNEDVNDRTGYVHIQTAGSEQVITVTQKQRDALTVSPECITVDPVNTSFSITAQHNVNYTVEIRCDWIREIKTKSYVSTDHHFSCDPNNSFKERTGYIIFRSGEKSETVTIIQKAIEINYGEESVYFDAYTGKKTISVRSNIELEITTDSEWIYTQFSIGYPEYHIYNYYVTIGVSENLSGDKRLGTVCFSVGGLSTYIQVSQSGFHCSLNNIYVSENGGEVTLSIITNQQFIIAFDSSYDWIEKIDERKVSENQTDIIFMVQPYSGSSSRICLIQVTDSASKNSWVGTLTQEYQAGVNRDVFNIDSSGGKIDISFSFSDSQGTISEYYIVDGVDWISHLPTRSIISNDYTFLIDKNQTGRPREGKIEFVHPDGKTKRYVTIKQSATLDALYFPDPVLKSYLLEHYDSNDDGEINPQEVYSITSLDISYLAVETLIGIENLTALNYLACNCNTLKEVIIPANLSYIQGFSSNTTIESVVFLEGVTSIQDWMFDGCSSLKSVKIPDSITKIGDSAFSGCASLIDLVIPSNANIGNYAFQKCINLSSVLIKDGVTNIGDFAFCDCKNLKYLVIPNTLKTLGASAFSGCQSLSTAVIPSGVNNIGHSAFSYCSNLSSLIIRDGVTTIDGYAFCGCSSLSNIVLPNSITNIGYFAFCDCDSLVEIEIPSSVRMIERSAFLGCSCLASLIINEGVTEIGDSAFKDCICLSNVVIPKSVISIDDSAFSDCRGISNLIINEGVTKIGKSAFNGCQNLIEIVIPNSVTTIGAYAFSYCGRLNSVDFSNSVTNIGEGAFQGCINLVSLLIPNKVLGIEELAFDKCPIEVLTAGNIEIFSSISKDKLRDLTVTGTVSYIPDKAFYGCNNLTSLILNEGVTSIGQRSFYGCSKLASVITPNSLMKIGIYAFSGCSSISNIIIPNSLTTIDIAAFNDCVSLTSIDLPNSVTSIGESAFCGCSRLANITIPKSITIIDRSVFMGCSSLANITIPNCVTEIGNKAFSGCISLTSVVIPDSVTTIGEGAFNECENLSSLILSNRLTRIARETFSGCSNLSEIIIPNSVTNIGHGAFSGCSSLTGVSFPNNVTSVDDYAFSGCSSLSRVEFSNSLTKIGVYAFYNCISLTSLLIPNKVESIGEGAFQNCPIEVLTIGNFDIIRFISKENLKDVTITGTVSFIPKYTFENYLNLSRVVIEDGVQRIDEFAFSGCKSLTRADIPSSVTYIDQYVFNGCHLTTLILRESYPPSFPSVSLGDGPHSLIGTAIPNYETLKIYVPANSINIYKTNTIWKNYASKIYSIDELE